MSEEFEVLIPDERCEILEFDQGGFSGVAVVNVNLTAFEPKAVFGWNCSVIITCEDVNENGMPSKAEESILDFFGDFLDDKIKGEDKEQPNGLFLAKVTWNNTRQLIWRVFDEEITNTFLTELTNNGNHKRPFDFRIDADETWELAEWYLRVRE